jgi:hypothetical protein
MNEAFNDILISAELDLLSSPQEKCLIIVIIGITLEYASSL